MDGKINGDNLDIYVKTNDIRMNNKNKDLHYFATDFTFDRVRLDHLEDTTAVGDPNNIDVQMFIPSSDEKTLYRNSLKYLIGRELVQNIKGLDWMNAIIPTHIPHDMEKVMCQKSKIFWLPLQLKNEMFHDQCIQIMNELEKHVNTIYSKAGRGGDLERLKTVVGGDQMTRVNLQSAIKFKKRMFYSSRETGASPSNNSGNVSHFDGLSGEVIQKILLYKMWSGCCNTCKYETANSKNKC